MFRKMVFLLRSGPIDLFHKFLYHVIEKAIDEPEVMVADNLSGDNEEQEATTPIPLTLDEFLIQRKLSQDGRNVHKQTAE